MSRIEDIIHQFNSLKEQGKLTDAELVVSKVIASDPHPKLFYMRGILFEQLEEYDRAFEDFSKAIELSPVTVQYYLSRGLLLSNRLNKGPEAILDFQTAVKYVPDSIEAHQHLCLSYLLEGDSDNALSSAWSAVDLDPTNYLSQFCLGQCYLSQNRFHAAIRDLKTAVSLNPRSAPSWSSLAQAYFAIEDFAKAAECHGREVEIAPTARALISLAKTQLKLGNIEKATESLRHARSFGNLTELDLLLIDGFAKIVATRPV